MTLVDMESSLRYHPSYNVTLTREFGGQCLVGSLTGAVAS